MAAAAQEAAGGASERASAAERASIERVGEGQFRIGAVRLDVRDKSSPTLQAPAEINMRDGMLELAACASGGKLHESLLLVHAEPYHLHLALLLMGLKPKGGVRYQGDTRAPEGDKAVIYIEETGKPGRRRIEDYIWDRQRRAPMEHTPWVFTGSRIIPGEGYGAQLTRTMITTYRDPYAILDNPLPSGADDTVYEVNSKITPAVGTTVTLIIQPHRRLQASAAEKGEGK